MKYFNRCSLLLMAALCSQLVVTAQLNDPAELVNPLMGTMSKPALSTGNMFPAVAVPWGMNQWTAQTGRMGDGWIYTYDADKIRGFKQTHQPSCWIGDYGQFSVMPVTGKMVFDQDARASWFSHKAETAKPYYYSVYLADYNVTAECTPADRGAQFRFTFPKTDSAFIVVDAFDNGSYIKIIPSEKKVIGYSTKQHDLGHMPDFKNFFVIYFDRPFDNAHTWEGNKLNETGLETKADHAGAIIGFKTQRGEQVHMRIATSFISFEQAELNYKREVAGDAFEQTMARAKKLWNDRLKRIETEGASLDQLRTFYSCLYRTMFYPHKMYEMDAANRPVHYSPHTGKVYPGYRFSGIGFWDTFRALYPLLNLLAPSINREMQAGLVNDYKEGGWLPEWSALGYTNIMVGNNSAAVVSDAYIKGLRGYDINTLYQALLHGANNEGPNATGRKGISYYKELGYVPYNVKINESAARTLEYAFDDFAIYQLGKALGRPEAETEIYKKRSQNYHNLFDAEYNLMRGKNKNGSFQTPFNPFKWGDAFTEGNSWHYTWSVFQDVQGLIDLMGGKENFVKQLDTVFALPPAYDDSYYGTVIHEIREMQIAHMGQYAHGNEPIQHMTYLYNYAGAPWKAQYWVRETLNRMYKPAPDGYCGDEDNGQTSAWYVFSALGFYPVTSCVDQYVIGTPLFKKVTIYLENGKKIAINAPDNNDQNRYIKSAKVNGRPYTKNWLSFSSMQKGMTVDFEMDAQPNKARGISDADVPYSMSRNDK
ncbi:GH92 family glycosyl hydrolase [Parafilimonas sp.]|uniref:GH92 family glycosyl hydrolase n=1 Tax=Parafilimonas sp. TaxID=1969739 RepID=UPI0039E62BAD